LALELDQITQNTNISTLQGQVTTINSEQTTQNTNITDLQTDVNALQDEINNLEPRITNLEGNFPLPLNNLSDVSISGLTNGQVLVYNGGASTWENENITPGVENLEELKDTEIISPLGN